VTRRWLYRKRNPAILWFALGMAVATVAMAGEKGYYERTGTKPPIQGDWMVGPKIHFGDQLGLGVHGGYFDRTNGVAYILGVDAVRIDALHGTTPYGCVRVPVNIDSRVRGVISFGVLFAFR